jgi:hypothetical protein
MGDALCYICLSDTEEEALLHDTCSCKDRHVHLSCQRDMIGSSLRTDPFSCPVCDSTFTNLLVVRRYMHSTTSTTTPPPPPLLRFALHHTAFLVCYRISSSNLALLAVWGVSSAVGLQVLLLRMRPHTDRRQAIDETTLLVCIGMTIAHMLVAVVTSLCNVPVLLLLQLCLLVASGATVMT